MTPEFISCACCSSRDKPREAMYCADCIYEHGSTRCRAEDGESCACLKCLAEFYRLQREYAWMASCSQPSADGDAAYRSDPIDWRKASR